MKHQKKSRKILSKKRTSNIDTFKYTKRKQLQCSHLLYKWETFEKQLTQERSLT